MNDWPQVLEKGTYIITAATYQKVHYFTKPGQLQFLCNSLLTLASHYGWNMQAWAVFSNHYHFIGQSPDNPQNISAFISHLHVNTAKYINGIDNTPNRKIWWQFWDSQITYQYSYYARINYVMQNPVRHGLVENALDYKCVRQVGLSRERPLHCTKPLPALKSIK